MLDHRKNLRNAKRSSKRQGRLELEQQQHLQQQPQLQEPTGPAADNKLRILLANVRGLSTRKKMEAFREKFFDKNDLGLNILMLTETHLTRQLDAKGW